MKLQGPCSSETCRRIVDLKLAFCPHCGYDLKEKAESGNLGEFILLNNLIQTLASDFQEHHKAHGDDFVKNGLEIVAVVKEEVEESVEAQNIGKMVVAIAIIKGLKHLVVNRQTTTETSPNVGRTRKKSRALVKTPFQERDKPQSSVDLMEQYMVLTIVLAGTVKDFYNVMVGKDPRKHRKNILTTIGIIKKSVSNCYR